VNFLTASGFLPISLQVSEGQRSRKPRPDFTPEKPDSHLVRVVFHVPEKTIASSMPGGGYDSTWMAFGYTAVRAVGEMARTASASQAEGGQHPGKPRQPDAFQIARDVLKQTVSEGRRAGIVAAQR
jgi:hypothetical protein